MVKSEVRQTGRCYVADIDSCLRTVKEIQAQVQTHNACVSGSRAVGGTLAAIGGTLVAAAAVTGGATAPFGLSLLASGGITTTGAQIGDYIKTSGFDAALRDAADKLSNSCVAFKSALLEHMKEEAKKKGHTEQQIASMTVSNLASVSGIGSLSFTTVEATAAVAEGTSYIIQPMIQINYQGLGMQSPTGMMGGAGVGGARGGAAVATCTGRLIAGASGVVGALAGGWEVHNGIRGFIDGHPKEEDIAELEKVLELAKADAQREVSKAT